MAFDYKREYKEFYLPDQKPVMIEVPEMNYIAIREKGDPSETNGEYQKANKRFTQRKISVDIYDKTTRFCGQE